MSTRDTLHAMSAILGSSLTAAFADVFRLMEIAEEEIEVAKRRHPEVAAVLHRAFLLLCPSTPLRGHSEKLYRVHCRELLARVRERMDTRRGTSAEIVASLSRLSLLCPLDRTATVLYWRLFEELFPNDAASLCESVGPVVADDYDKTSAAELERGLRRKLSVSDRRLPEPDLFSEVA